MTMTFGCLGTMMVMMVMITMLVIRQSLVISTLRWSNIAGFKITILKRERERESPAWKTSIVGGISIAVLDYQRVMMVHKKHKSA